MEVPIPCGQNPFLFPCIPITKTPQTLSFFQLPIRRRLKIKASSSSANPSGSGSNGFSWNSLARSLRLGSEQFWSKFGESVKKETGFDLDEATVRVAELVGRVKDGFSKREGELTRFRTELVPEFVRWNRWERWKDFKNWEPKRITTLILYIFVALISCQKLYAVVRGPQLDRERKQLTEAYMEALIPEPSPSNIRKFKKSLWRKTTPKGLKLKKFIEGPNGMLIHDSSYVGENAWDDDPEPSKENVKHIIESDARLNAEEKEELIKDLGILGEVPESMGTWRERLQTWKEILRKEKLSEQLDSINAKYAVEFDMKEVENSLRKDVVEKVTETQGARALWISKRWWRYRPKLPYTYFLQKLESSERAKELLRELQNESP